MPPARSLTAEQFGFFDTNGYLVLKQFSSEEDVWALRDRMAELIAGIGGGNSTGPCEHRGVGARLGLLQGAARPGRWRGADAGAQGRFGAGALGQGGTGSRRGRRAKWRYSRPAGRRGRWSGSRAPGGRRRDARHRAGPASAT
ncbi:hypothetical protein BAE44_0006305 [Dichanthelium oligosanthes]|uniref:Phytanoyl-CoA dioxygenase family protein n=1 Tax=Dichanthelium oligosanthes TaxID=888268 RepID=A0A1E5W5N9_9POAL|nr:hypothetical protein BAE44_0006305 [Dichanthelium oligosanthes]